MFDREQMIRTCWMTLEQQRANRRAAPWAFDTRAQRRAVVANLLSGHASDEATFWRRAAFTLVLAGLALVAGGVL